VKCQSDKKKNSFDSCLTKSFSNDSQEIEVEDGEAEGDAMPKITKKKIVKVEENQSKKEHVNVVFIGHVGKCDF
jgi:hypothetical protein